MKINLKNFTKPDCCVLCWRPLSAQKPATKKKDFFCSIHASQEPTRKEYHTRRYKLWTYFESKLPSHQGLRYSKETNYVLSEKLQGLSKNPNEYLPSRTQFTDTEREMRQVIREVASFYPLTVSKLKPLLNTSFQRGVVFEKELYRLLEDKLSEKYAWHFSDRVRLDWCYQVLYIVARHESCLLFDKKLNEDNRKPGPVSGYRRDNELREKVHRAYYENNGSKRLTQKEVGKLFGISQARVSKLISEYYKK